MAAHEEAPAETLWLAVRTKVSMGLASKKTKQK